MVRCLMVVVASVSLYVFGGTSVDMLSGNQKIVTDGRLNEAAWQSAKWNGNFVRLAESLKDRAVTAQTKFAVIADSKAVYVAVKCEDPDLAATKAAPRRSLHSDHRVELFFAPNGGTFDFYQFVIGFSPVNGHEIRYASEGGAIEPDPYGGDWKFARGEFAGGWCVEIEIPFSSFYMTRNRNWRDTWRVNVTRRWASANDERRELSTWSPLRKGFVEPKNFRKMEGFPIRLPADDVGITDVAAEISGRRGGKLAGTLSFDVTVAQGGEYEASSPDGETKTVTLAPGLNNVCMPCAYSGNGRYNTRIELKRKTTGERYARSYPVVVDFEEIRLSLVSPEYRNNFYPGQDASRVKGMVHSAGEGDVIVTLDGPGFPKRQVRLPVGGGEIDFNTKGFQIGTAMLTVENGSVKRDFKIRRLAKTNRRMAWISKGRLVVDGKPVLRRGVYAEGYMGGKAFAERFAADSRLYLTPETTSGGTLEPERVVRGLLMREARNDVVPCKEYFERIDKKIAASKDRDFVSWYISDEPECRKVSPVYLRHIYEYMKEKDPYHVILMSTRGGKRYIDCSDWFETHPYLNPHYDGTGKRQLDNTPDRVGRYLDAFDASNRPDKCIGFIPTMFAYRSKSVLNDYPTFPEYVCHVWAAMMHGGKTLRPYAYHDMGDRPSIYEGNRYVNSTFEVLDDFILDGRRTTLLKSSEAECVRWDLANGKAMFALANFTDRPQKIPLPAGLSDRRWHAFRGQWAEGRELLPYEVVVGVSEERGKELETYAETQALVDRLEYERTHRDNQILEKYFDLNISSSTRQTSFHKLIDGVRDVVCWLAKGKVSWVDIAFKHKPVNFSRVIVYGSGIENMKVSIRKGGEWVELKPGSVKAENYKRELDFGKVHSTVKMRISFTAEKRNSTVELYEVELPECKSKAKTVSSPAVRKAPLSSALEDKSSVLWSLYEGGAIVSKKVAHGVKIDPAYPWLEIEVDSFTQQKPRKYSAWKLWFLKQGDHLAGGVTHPQPGLYVVRMPKVEKAIKGILRFDDYNFDISVKRLRCVKDPANFIVAEAAGGVQAVRPGGALDVTLTLADPCEDVSVELLQDRGGGRGFVGFPVNGSSSVQMKMLKESGGRVWKASIPVKSCGKAGARRVFVKCTVLGGTLTTPLFTTVVDPFEG